jgi:DNA (cytosine-5)-methyltransferase 1
VDKDDFIEVIDSIEDRIIDALAPTLPIRQVQSGSDDNRANAFIIEAGNLNNPGWHRANNVVLDPFGISTTITTSEQPKIVDPNIAYGYYTNASDNYVLPPLKNLARTIKAEMHDSGIVYQDRIRKLTPLECFRLMGFSDEDFYKCRAAGLSDTQLFKQSGNSIVVNVLEEIFKMMLP